MDIVRVFKFIFFFLIYIGGALNTYHRTDRVLISALWPIVLGKTISDYVADRNNMQQPFDNG